MRCVASPAGADCVAAIPSRRIYCEDLGRVSCERVFLQVRIGLTGLGLLEERRQLGRWVRHVEGETTRVSAASRVFSCM